MSSQLHHGSQERAKIEEPLERAFRTYLRASRFQNAERSQQDQLAQAVQQNPTSSEAWWRFFSHEEGQALSHIEGAKHGRTEISLFQLYRLATQSIPRHGNSNNPAYLQIWLSFARHQWLTNVDEARDTFKMLKSQFLGDDSAHLYSTWAILEAESGHVGRAQSVLRKGFACNAHPRSMLEDAQKKVEGLARSGPGRLSAGKDLGDTVEFTATMEVTAKHMDEDHPGTTGRYPITTGTRHSSTSEDATFTLINSHSPVTGHTGGSSSSHGTTREVTETQDLSRPRTTEGLKSALVVSEHPASSTLQHGLQHRKIGHRPLQSSLKGPRRIGLGGGAARVPSAPAQLLITSAEQQSDSPQSSGEKRKAEQDLADSPHGCQLDLQPRKRLSSGDQASIHPAPLHLTESTDQAQEQRSLEDEETATYPLNTLARRARDSMAPQLIGRQKHMPVGLLRGTAKQQPQAELIGTPLSFVTERRSAMGKVLRDQQSAQRLSTPATQPALSTTLSATGQKLRQIPAPPASASNSERSRMETSSDIKPAGPSQTILPQPIADRSGHLHSTAQDHGQARQQGRAPTARQPLAEIPAEKTRHERSQEDPDRPWQNGAGHAEACMGNVRSDHNQAKTCEKASQSQERAPPSSQCLQTRLEHASNRPQNGAAEVSLHSDMPEGEDLKENLAPLRMTSHAAEAASDRPANLSMPRHHSRTDAMQNVPVSTKTNLEGTTGLGDQMAGLCLGERNQAKEEVQASEGPSQSTVRQIGDKDSRKVAEAQIGRAARASQPQSVEDVIVNQARSTPQAGSVRQQIPGERAKDTHNPRNMGPPPARPSATSRDTDGSQRASESQAASKPVQRVVREDENTVLVRRTRYTKLECVGRGGSSKVFKVMAPNRKIYALKRIKLQGRDREAATGFIDEISLLQRLQGHSNIIQLIDAEVIHAEGLIYMVLEYGDIDLARLLAKHEKACRDGGSQDLDENFIRLYWQQMLQAVHIIHEARIVHSDLKPANFLMVEGTLKLIDFGIAKAISSDTTSIARESQVGTLNYMSPEALLGGANNIRGGPPMKVGRASDIWSLGCILYQMVHGHTPFSSLAFIQKMHAITDPRHRIAFPPLKNAALQDTLQRCLDRNARTRIQMQELMDHPFLRPTRSAVPGLVGVTRSQLKKLLAQLSTVSGDEKGTNIDLLSEELFKQLSQGESVDLQALLSTCKSNGDVVAKPKKRQPLAALSLSQPHDGHPKYSTASSAKVPGRQELANFRYDDTAASSLSTQDPH